MGPFLAHLKLTHNFPEIGKPVLENGFYASIHDLGNNRGVAISIDGVGSKLLVAQAANQLSPVGKDIVAVNVNDILCVGARPETVDAALETAYEHNFEAGVIGKMVRRDERAVRLIQQKLIGIKSFVGIA